MSNIGVTVSQGTLAGTSATVISYFGAPIIVAKIGLTGVSASIAKGTIGFAAGSIATYATADDGMSRGRDLFMGNVAGAVDSVTQNRGGFWGLGVGWFNGLTDSYDQVRRNGHEFSGALQTASDKYQETRNTVNRGFDAAKSKCEKLLE